MSEKNIAGKIKQFYIPALVVVSIVLAFFVGMLSQKVKTSTTGTTGNTVATPTAVAKADIKTIKGLFDKDLIKFGDAKSKVIFVEMSDPSCPYCHIAGGYDPELAAAVGARFKYVSAGGTYTPPGPEMEKLVEAGKASYIYIYYPGHGNGEMAMKALYCANEQGKFWEVKKLVMTDAGYALQNGQDSAGKAPAVTVGNDKTKSADMANFLKSAIDPVFMQSCLDSGKYDARLQSDQDLAVSLGIQGTPNFYVNDTNFAGAYSFSDMQSVVDAALK
jgi:protein-disulfide isomerase